MFVSSRIPEWRKLKFPGHSISIRSRFRLEVAYRLLTLASIEKEHLAFIVYHDDWTRIGRSYRYQFLTPLHYNLFDIE